MTGSDNDQVDHQNKKAWLFISDKQTGRQLISDPIDSSVTFARVPVDFARACLVSWKF
jgi:hypothetical protein